MCGLGVCGLGVCGMGVWGESGMELELDKCVQQKYEASFVFQCCATHLLE